MSRVEWFLARRANECYYCSAKLVSFRDYPERPLLERKLVRIATLDHLVPKKRGGTGEQANIVLCCLDCNQAKGDKTAEEFVK